MHVFLVAQFKRGISTTLRICATLNLRRQTEIAHVVIALGVLGAQPRHKISEKETTISEIRNNFKLKLAF